MNQLGQEGAGFRLIVEIVLVVFILVIIFAVISQVEGIQYTVSEQSLYQGFQNSVNSPDGSVIVAKDLVFAKGSTYSNRAFASSVEGIDFECVELDSLDSTAFEKYENSVIEFTTQYQTTVYYKCFLEDDDDECQYRQAMRWVTASPLNETKSLLTDLVGSPGALKHTPEVVFKPDDVLAASALVERLPISKDQVCMSTGQFEEDPDNGYECIGCEDVSDNQRLIYHGSSNQAARLAVVCNVNLGELQDDIEAYNLEPGKGNDWEGSSIEEACEVCEGKGKCCAVVLKRS